jgi:ABC-2 type transport system permease protein
VNDGFDPRSVRVVAEKGFTDAIRSRTLLALGAFFVLFIGGTAAVVGYVADGIAARVLFGTSLGTGFGLRLSYAGMLGFIVGLTALLAAYGAVVGERASGTLKLLLSLPHSRLNVVLGKVLGRTTVVVLPVLVGFLVAALAFLATGGTVDFLTFTPLVFLTLLLVAAFVSLAVGISAAAPSERRATLGAVGTYVIFALFWAPIGQGLRRIVDLVLRELPGVEPLSAGAGVKLTLAVKLLNPLRAYETLVASLYSSPLQGRLVLAGFRERLVVQQTFDGLPVYLSDPAVALVLVFWVVAPLAYGYALFRTDDL